MVRTKRLAGEAAAASQQAGPSSHWGLPKHANRTTAKKCRPRACRSASASQTAELHCETLESTRETSSKTSSPDLLQRRRQTRAARRAAPGRLRVGRDREQTTAARAVAGASASKYFLLRPLSGL